MTNPMRETRTKLKLTQEEMGKRLGCSVWTVTRHEKNLGLTVGPWLLALRQLLVEDVCNDK